MSYSVQVLQHVLQIPRHYSTPILKVFRCIKSPKWRWTNTYTPSHLVVRIPTYVITAFKRHERTKELVMYAYVIASLHTSIRHVLWL